MNREEREVEKILQEEIDKQADEILSELEDDETLEDIILPEDFDEKMKKEFMKFKKEQEAYEQLSEKDKEALRIGREIQIQKENDKLVEDTSKGKKIVPFKKKKKKVYLIVAVVAILVMGIGTTAMGENPFKLIFADVAIGNQKVENINNSKENEKDVTDVENNNELELYAKIRDEFNFEPVKLDGIPEDSFFIEGDVDTNIEEAYLIYGCGEEILEYRMTINYNSKASGYRIMDEVLDEYIMYINNIPVEIKECKIIEKNKKQYVAKFMYENVQYIITTTLPKDQFEQILNSMIFF